jgi:hypothetical protein
MTAAAPDPIDISTFSSPSAAAIAANLQSTTKSQNRYLANSKSSSNLYYNLQPPSASAVGGQLNNSYAATSQQFQSPMQSDFATVGSPRSQSRQHKTLSMHGGGGGGGSGGGGTMMQSFSPSQTSQLPQPVTGSRRPHALMSSASTSVMSSASTSGGLDWWNNGPAAASSSSTAAVAASMGTSGNGILPPASRASNISLWGAQQNSNSVIQVCALLVDASFLTVWLGATKDKSKFNFLFRIKMSIELLRNFFPIITI